MKEILSKAYAKVRQTGEISPDTLEKMRLEFYASGIKCIPMIKIGTVYDGKKESIIEVSDYTEAFPENENVDVRGRMVIFIAEFYESGFGEKLANMFWDTYISGKKFVRGGFVYG